MAKQPGESYKDDTFYRPIEIELEKKYGLWDGALGDIRTKGERTDASKVSPAGARSVYQIIPQSQQAVLSRAGVNAYASPAAAAEAAAILLKGSLDRNKGDSAAAVREYVGGTNPKNWGPVTHAYVERVLGAQPAEGGWSGDTYQKPTFEQIWNGGIQSIGVGRPDKPAKSAEEIAAKVTQHSPIWDVVAADGPVIPEGPAVSQMGQQVAAQTEGAAKAKVASEGTAWDKTKAVISENWLGSQLWRGIEQEDHTADPTWIKKFGANYDQYMQDARSWDDWEALVSERGMRSEADFKAIQQERAAKRRREELISSTGHGALLSFGATLADPVGFLATAGVGKVLQLGKFAATGVKAGQAGLGFRVAEGAALGATFAGAAQYGGEDMGVADYLEQMVAGAGIGAALHGVSQALARKPSEAVLGALTEAEGAAQRTARNMVTELRANAEAKLGPDATPEAVEAEMIQQATRSIESIQEAAAGPRLDADRFLPSNPALARVQATTEVAGEISPSLQASIDKFGLGGWTNREEQKLAAEMGERAVEMVKANPITSGLEGRFLKAFGAESDALTLLRSENPVLQALAIQLAESTTGAGGRKPSAALSMVLHERQLMSPLVATDRAFQLWRNEQGISRIKSWVSNEARMQFDELVAEEITLRGLRDVASVSENRAVVMAADAYEQGFGRAAKLMKSAETLGHERIPESPRGYLPRHLDPRKLIPLSQEQRRAVEAIVSKQLQDLNTFSYVDKEGNKVTKNFDKAFSDNLAKDYIRRGIDRGMGTTFVPANIHTGEAGQILEDAIKAMGTLSYEEQQAILGRFSRGGPSFTKGRLDLDLSADIGNGMTLGDLFVKDMDVLYRSYMRRAAGQVALAQYGVYGRPGVELLRSLAQATGASPQQLKAYERVMSEFLNEPWKTKGQYDHAFQNLRLVTSAARLGGMAFPQLGEFANALPTLGVRSTFAAIAEMPKMLRQTRAWVKGGKLDDPILKDFDALYGHIGGEDFMANTLFDVRDNAISLYDQESLGVVSKAVRAGANINMIMSGFRAMHSAQRRGLAKQIVLKTFKFIKEGGNEVAMRDMGLSPELQATIKKHIDSIISLDSKGNITKVGLVNSPLPSSAIHDLMQVTERGAGQIIQKTFVGETGPWAHDEQLKLLLQFRTFGVTSIEKQYGRTVAMYGNAYGAARAFGVMVGAMAFAYPIHMLRVAIASSALPPSERKAYFDQHTTAGAMARGLMNYTSILGLAPDAADVVATVATQMDGTPPDWLKNDFGSRGRVPNSGSYIPAIGYVNDALSAGAGLAQAGGSVIGMNNKPDAAKKLVKALKLMPGASNPAVGALFHGVTETQPEE